MKILSVLVLTFLLIPCDAKAEQQVKWNTYSPIVKQRIDESASKKECGKLQVEFDTAEANSKAHRARHGVSNSDLMGYIDEKMTMAGCYK